MYAPVMPYFGMKRKIWHMVHPLDLKRSVCATGILNCVEAVDELSEEADYCAVCAARERFVEQFAG